MAISISRPTRLDRTRKPHTAIVGNSTPVTIIIEVLVANDVPRNIASRHGMLFTKVAIVAPSIEVIVAAQSVNIGRELVASGEGGMLVCMNREGLAATSHF